MFECNPIVFLLFAFYIFNIFNNTFLRHSSFLSILHVSTLNFYFYPIVNKTETKLVSFL